MSDQNRFCLGDRTSCNSIKQYPLQSGCIRNVHYPLKSGNFVQRVEKNRTRKDFLARFLVEVTGFEPATFWSRRTSKLPGCLLPSVCSFFRVFNAFSSAHAGAPVSCFPRFPQYFSPGFSPGFPPVRPDAGKDLGFHYILYFSFSVITVIIVMCGISSYCTPQSGTLQLLQ